MTTKLRSLKTDTSGVPKTVGAPISLPNGAVTSHPRTKRRGPNPPPISSSSRHSSSASRTRLEESNSHIYKNKPPSQAKSAGSSRAGHVYRQSSGKQNSLHTAWGSRGSASSRPGSARSVRSDVSQDNEDSDDDIEEQDVRFINIDSRNCSSAGSHGKSLRVFERSTREISSKSVLIFAQENDPEQVFEVSLHGAQIGRISNLEKFTKLRILDLSCNFIQKIEHLEQNNSLRELKLYDNEINKIENLDHLSDLCHLQLQHNKIKNIEKGLASLRKLTMLRLDYNLIFKIDIRELAAVSKLTSLDLSYNKLDNLGALNSLPNLEELYVVGNRLRVVSDLSRCRKLQEVDVSSNRLTDLSGLKQLPNLSTLRASNNFLNSMKSLGKLKSMQELKVTGNRLFEAKELVNLFPSLQVIDLVENNLEVWDDVCALKALPELVELYIAGNPFCSDEGCKPMYHGELHSLISQLEILDGAQVQKKQATAVGTPLMRPMTASTVISARQVEAQLHSFADELASYETSITAKFDHLRTLTDEVCPAEVAETFSRSSSAASSRPSSKSGKRSRIKEAQEYAVNVDRRY